MKRRQAIILSVALLAFATGALAAHVVLLPRYAERKLVQKAARHGINLDAGKVSMLGSWLRFSDVVACSGDCGPDDPLVLKIGMLRVKPDLAALLRGRAEASVVDVSLLKARVDITRPGPLMALMKRAGSSEGTGERKGGKSGAGRRIPEIRGDGLDLEVIVADGVSATFSGARVMPGDEDGMLALDLGTTTFSGFGVEMNARHVILDMDPSAGKQLVRGVNLVSPSITVDEELVKKLASKEEPREDLPQEEGLVATASETFISGLSVEEVLSQLPVPVVEFSGAHLVVPAEGARAGLELTRMKGSVSMEADGGILCKATGEAYQGPISVEITARPEKIAFQADTPYIPASVLDGLVEPPQGVRIDAARFMIDGSGSLDRNADRFVFDGTLGGTGITIDSKKVALEPVLDVHFLLDGHLEMDRKSDTITVSESRIEASGIPVDLSSASLTKLEKGYQIAARGKIPHTHCQELFNSLPFEMRSSLPGLIFEGELGMDFDVQMDWQNPDDAVLDFSVDNRCKVVSEGSLKLGKFGSTFVHHVKDKVGEHEFVMGPGSASWVNLEEVAEHMPHAIVTTEDGAFYKHKGISVFAIKRAAIKNVKKGYFAFGASTITMQLVKNLFLSRDRTISRKLQEMIITWWVENSMDKDQIIELYLNVVEFGPAIYGIRNASLHYFNKEPSELSLLECAYLAKMLPNPVGRYRYYEKGGIDEKWRAVLERVVTKMFTRNYITEEEWKEAMADDFTFYYPSGSDLIEENPYEEPPAAASPFPDFSAE